MVGGVLGGGLVEGGLRGVRVGGGGDVESIGFDMVYVFCDVFC